MSTLDYYILFSYRFVDNCTHLGNYGRLENYGCLENYGRLGRELENYVCFRANQFFPNNDFLFVVLVLQVGKVNGPGQLHQACKTFLDSSGSHNKPPPEKSIAVDVCLRTTP